MRRVVSGDVAGAIAAGRRTLQLLGVRLDLASVGARTSRQTARDCEVSGLLWLGTNIEIMQGGYSNTAMYRSPFQIRDLSWINGNSSILV